ncbi:hypothetical protein XACJK48_6290021 [Xanthomonas citri pv. citri]|nr:hypothetical protein XAC3824_790022 [Xanthomonas citri pv. citri]CEE46906.1 hypothetical protein XAC2911_670019 [Xanthomonas citri pv. citri]CEE50867.1 hypothetical protein XACS584_1040020 [Xanthomonas citri pv. citri]CEE68176.1 hypothetical protein XAC71A_840022 [Xanthomonas citri pv. citri]CEF20853.1 hypothetical protein XACJK2_1240036 [Xanthomonas citri pv. citri]
MEDTESLKFEDWPDAVAFVPYVGSRYYLEGFGGRRVLLLGESHYRGRVDRRPRLHSPFHP